VRSHNSPRGPAPSRSYEENDPEFWKAIRSGDFVGIRDAEGFASRLADGAEAGTQGQDYAVGEIRDFEILGPEGGGPGKRARLGLYRFIELRKEGSGPLYLVLVEGGEAFERRLYFIPEGLACGTRDELIDAGNAWLFLPPTDPEDFKSSELEYAPFPDVPEIEENGESRKLLFSPAGSGKSLYGEAADTLAAVIITEYAAEEEENPPANPLLLVLEEGWIRSDGSQPEEGGYVTILLGKVLRAGDIEHFPSA
jgi:hypothetical protein